MDKEGFFISFFSSKINGDDGAFCDGYVYSKDAFFENVHFKRDWFSLKEIAIKASLVNLSDVIAMNAIPKYALISIALPNDITTNQIKELTSGFLEVAQKYNYEIIGGDTIANNKLDISMTFISTTKKPIFRKGIKDNNLILYTGDLGSVNKDLKRLFRNKKIKKTSKFKTPKIRNKFMKKANRYINACLDISDGLFKELDRLSKINNIGYKFFKKFDKIGCSGEEYELLFAVNKRHLKYIQNIAKLTKTPVTLVAKAKKSKKFKSICKENHFD